MSPIMQDGGTRHGHGDSVIEHKRAAPGAAPRRVYGSNEGG
jgi:hypothetical protein